MNWQYNLADFISVQATSGNILLFFSNMYINSEVYDESHSQKADFAQQITIFVVILMALNRLLPNILLML